MGATSRPRCSEQRIRQRLVHPQTRVAGFCAAAGTANPSHRIASRRACMSKPRTTEDKAHGSLLPHSLAHSFGTLRSVGCPFPSIPSCVPILPPPRGHHGLVGRLVSRTARRERDRGGRRGEKERGRRKAGRRGRTSASEANKEERASEETRTGDGGGGRGERGGKEDYYYYYYYSSSPPHHTACRRDASP